MSGGMPEFSGNVRIARGLALGGLTLTISLAGHAAPGGLLPNPATLAVMLLIATLLCVSVADRRRSVMWMLASMAALQVLLHVVASVVVGHPGHSSAMPSLTMLLGHAVATIVAVVALSHSETLWARWQRFLLSLTRRVRPGSLPEPHEAPVSAVGTLVPGEDDYAIQPVTRRGPPVPRLA